MKTKVETEPDSNKDEIKIVFTPSGHQGKVNRGLSVLEAARALGVDIDSVCGGRAMCGRCQIDISEGEFAKHGIVSKFQNLSEKTKSEKRYADKRKLQSKRRLSCQAKILNQIVIDVPQESQVHRQVIRKAADDRDVIIDPVVNLFFVEVREPNMHEPSGDFRRLIEALETQWPSKINGEISADLHVHQKIQKILRKGNWKVTVAVRGENRIIEIWPGLKETIYGVALDIGSTTISAHLVDLHTGATKASTGKMNPQIRFGEDLMSRVSYVMMNPGGDKEMASCVRLGVEELIVSASKQAKIEVTDILEIVFVGNPVMHHLFLGIDPIELGGAPFALSFDGSIECLAKELDININPGTRLYGLPCIAGHVGADAAAVTLAEEPYNKKEISLLIDVGTNAEIILGNDNRLLAASSPTGPAFEGAQISCGQRAAAGAIERVRIDPETLESKFCIIGTEGWLDKNSIEDINVSGICGSGIIEVLGEMYLSGILTTDGVIRGDLESKFDCIQKDGRTFSYKLTDNVIITQNDVRAIQLAKAALHAGFRLLMDRMEVDKIDKVMLAGAFGSHIEPKYAMILGMVPDCNLSAVRSVGNSAGAGARLALLSKNKRNEVEAMVRGIEKIETAVEPSFQDHFVEAMAFPHKTNPYQKLSGQIKMPPIFSKTTFSNLKKRRRTNRTIR